MKRAGDPSLHGGGGALHSPPESLERGGPGHPGFLQARPVASLHRVGGAVHGAAVQPQPQLWKRAEAGLSFRLEATRGSRLARGGSGRDRDRKKRQGSPSRCSGRDALLCCCPSDQDWGARRRASPIVGPSFLPFFFLSLGRRRREQELLAVKAAEAATETVAASSVQGTRMKSDLRAAEKLDSSDWRAPPLTFQNHSSQSGVRPVLRILPLPAPAPPTPTFLTAQSCLFTCACLNPLGEMEFGDSVWFSEPVDNELYAQRGGMRPG
ncbi:hypothetical protein H920_06482 [Fukomys damarensis]|uniref:Uncharacterized protein n=1 Tax=Fukomys damarensis TaxID=885580 RepID=A0A091EA89_FUKDA|nr:hypothetical protein H920_06482 [Fukomys damarensis]